MLIRYEAEIILDNSFALMETRQYDSVYVYELIDHIDRLLEMYPSKYISRVFNQVRLVNTADEVTIYTLHHCILSLAIVSGYDGYEAIKSLIETVDSVIINTMY